jgi:uncharacterized protein with PIN domain
LNFFFDTSALAKIYHQEDESDRVIAIFNSDDNSIFVSELSAIEYYSVVYRKFKEKQIDGIDLEKILKRFEIDMSNRFELLIFSPPVITNAKDAFRVLGQEVFVRSLDVIQLGFFKSYLDYSDIFLTFDSRQSLAVEELKKKDFFSTDGR